LLFTVALPAQKDAACRDQISKAFIVNFTFEEFQKAGAEANAILDGQAKDRERLRCSGAPPLSSGSFVLKLVT
jgi:hypothetical protein